jgi:enoyl-CoA hydratase
MLGELERCVEAADLDPAVHAIALAGNGKGFCGGYDLVESAEGQGVRAEGQGVRAEAEGVRAEGQGVRAEGDSARARARAREGGAAHVGMEAPTGSPLDPAVIAANHDPGATWDPMVDHAMMSRNVRAFMALFHCSKPVVCSVHGFCVAGGTDMALCADLLVIADDAKIGYPPARVWGSPTTAMWAFKLGAQRAKRLLFTGDCLSGAEALQWGLAIEAPPAEKLRERTEILMARICQVPVNQLRMMKLLVNQTMLAQGLAGAQALGTLLDGIARHTHEGYAFQAKAAAAGFKEAVRERDEPFGDRGASTFKG